jgi:hypothetical protein
MIAVLWIDPLDPLLVAQCVFALIAVWADDHDIAKGMFAAERQRNHMVRLLAVERASTVGAKARAPFHAGNR